MHSALYHGSLEHRRHAPRAHAFRYGLFMVYLDLAELDTVFAGRWLWSTRRAAPARFDRARYFGDPRVPLDAAVRTLVHERTGRRPEGPIRLLTHLAYFGYAFNPVSFYFCFDAAGERVQTVVAEVTNTPWKERHCYVLPAAADGTVDARSVKAMHVSPFHPMEMEYRWRVPVPGESLDVHMALHATGACDSRTLPVFHANLALRRKPITGRSLATALVRHPLMTAQVIVGIHWQALRLLLKRVPVHDHPARHARAAHAITSQEHAE